MQALRSPPAVNVAASVSRRRAHRSILIKPNGCLQNQTSMFVLERYNIIHEAICDGQTARYPNFCSLLLLSPEEIQGSPRAPHRHKIVHPGSDALIQCDGRKPARGTCSRMSRKRVYDQEKTRYESLLYRFRRAQDQIKTLEERQGRLISTLRVAAPDHSLLHNGELDLSPSRVSEGSY